MSADIQQLTTELHAAVVSVQAAAEVIKSPFFIAQLSEALAAAHVQANSPWLDRKSAAAYAHSSTSEIDRGADAGFFRRYFRAGTPLFKKSEIDTAIEDGKWLKRGQRPVPPGERKAA